MCIRNDITIPMIFSLLGDQDGQRTRDDLIVRLDLLDELVHARIGGDEILSALIRSLSLWRIRITVLFELLQ